LRNFIVGIVSNLLDDIATMYSLNTETVGKVRSILRGVFTDALGEGHFPGKSATDNPARLALMPESVTEPTGTVAATFEEVQGCLAALKQKPLERAAVTLMAYSGTRRPEMLGLRWDEWDRTHEHITVKRAVWRGVIGDTKTDHSVRFVTVIPELRTILLTLWRSQGSPISGFILAASNGKPVILDNPSKRSIRMALNRCAVCHEAEFAEHNGHAFKRDESLPEWHGFYALRRFHGTEVRLNSESSETTAKALGNTKEVAEKHYIKPQTVLPNIPKAVTSAMRGLAW
jgi:integrase